MKTVVCLDKDDIHTGVIGNNIWANVSSEYSISFTVDALEELLKDYAEIKAAKAKESEVIDAT